MHVLEDVGVMTATARRVRNLDRTKLEEVAGGCYGVPEAEHERPMGLPLKPSRHSELVAAGLIPDYKAG